MTNDRMEDINRVMPSFAAQLRLAADDPDVREVVLRCALRDAAKVMESQQHLVNMWSRHATTAWRTLIFIGAACTVLSLLQTANTLGWL